MMNANTVNVVKTVGKEVLKMAVKIGLPLATNYFAAKELDEKVAKAVAKAMQNNNGES